MSGGKASTDAEAGCGIGANASINGTVVTWPLTCEMCEGGFGLPMRVWRCLARRVFVVQDAGQFFADGADAAGEFDQRHGGDQDQAVYGDGQ
ncbi:hypothetical protein ACFQX7_28195 [Luedemannella flava]